MTAISGGKFWSGFAAGAVSSIAASAWSGGGSESSYHGAGSFASSGVGMISFGIVSGGVGARLTGGNFWQGAVTGLVVSGLNHAMHPMDGGNIDPPGKKGKLLSKLNENTTVIGNTVSGAGAFSMALEDVSHIRADQVYKEALNAQQLTRLNRVSQLRIAKYASAGGKMLGGAGALISGFQYSQGQISGYELSADLIMTGVGFIGPIGAGASLIYFGGKAIYNYYNPENPVFAIPKN